jgi:hypothetical protein
MEEPKELTQGGVELLSGIVNFKVLALYKDGSVVYGMDYRSTEAAVLELLRHGYIELYDTLEVADIYRITQLGESRVIRKR